MLYGFDVDETLTEETGAFTDYIAPKIGVRLDGPLPFDAFFSSPEVEAYREKNAGQFWEYFKQAGHNSEVLRNLMPRAGAVEGVRYLQALGKAGYYTARASNLQTLTQEWLQAHQFPTLDYYPCFNFLQKILKLYQHSRATNEITLLIDDNAVKIAGVWPQVAQKWPPIGEFFPSRFILVGFGCTPESLSSLDVPFPVLALPSWEMQHIQNLLKSIASLSQEEILHV